MDILFEYARKFTQYVLPITPAKYKIPVENGGDDNVLVLSLEKPRHTITELIRTEKAPKRGQERKRRSRRRRDNKNDGDGRRR